MRPRGPPERLPPPPDTMVAFRTFARLLLLLLLLLVASAFVIHYSLSGLVGASSSRLSSFGASPSSWPDVEDSTLDDSCSCAPDLRRRIDRLRGTKQSVVVELLAKDKERRELQSQVAAFHKEIEDLRAEATRARADLERARLSVGQAQLALEEYSQRNTPDIRPPLSLRATVRDDVKVTLPLLGDSCSTEECFDFARCPLSSGFPIYLYGSDSSRRLFGGEINFLQDPTEACLFVAIVEEDSAVKDAESLLHWLETLSHFNGDGRNHLVIIPKGLSLHVPLRTRAIVAQSHTDVRSFRQDFDITTACVPMLSELETVPAWRNNHHLLPVRRRYLLSFVGSKQDSPMSQTESLVISIIHEIKPDKTDDDAYVDVSCIKDPSVSLPEGSDWALCGHLESRADILRSSTFALIFAPDRPLLSTGTFQRRLTEALKCGAIPVVLGAAYPHLTLPFSEVLDWKSALVSLPYARVTELHFVLRSFTDADLFSMKRQGSLIWQSYFSSTALMLKTVLHTLRERLQLPPLPFADSPSPSVFEDDKPPKTKPPNEPIEPEEQLGPLEQPRPSLAFRRNFSSVMLGGDRRARWNSLFNPFYLSPFTPFESELPSDAKFLGSPYGFRPVAGGSGGAGLEFSQVIGGNRPTEQFTIVMLTYERDLVLLDALSRLDGLPYLNKVVVVWNSPLPPSPDLEWPEISVPIRVVQPGRNSLNNRFLPFDAIETEAVLSIDDDSFLRHDEIVFAFRVWRENRDRLVGFPGRFHAWDLDHSAWLYNSNHSCELSMVLTGAAFFHKYYSYVYTHLLPKEVHQRVDEYMNCEDLAMNYLISHLTRKPPIKVTTKWTFRCPECPVSLTEDEHHFDERHKCMNFLAEVFGYMPLLYTQFRADSVLFKTKIPPTKQKCFRYI